MEQPPDNARRQFSLAKLIGVLTFLAFLLGGIRVVGLWGLVYLCWGGGVLLGMWLPWGTRASKDAGWQFIVGFALTLSGGSLGMFFGAGLADQLQATGQLVPPQTPFAEELVGFAIAGALLGLVVFVIAWAAASLTVLSSSHLQGKAISSPSPDQKDTNPQAEVSSMGMQALVVAIVLLSALWLVMLIVRMGEMR